MAEERIEKGAGAEKDLRMNNKWSLQLAVAVAMCLFGCILVAAGFIVAPKGQIHESVLICFGEVITFAGALFGVDYHYRKVIRKIKKDE